MDFLFMEVMDSRGHQVTAVFWDMELEKENP